MYGERDRERTREREREWEEWESSPRPTPMPVLTPPLIPTRTPTPTPSPTHNHIPTPSHTHTRQMCTTVARFRDLIRPSNVGTPPPLTSRKQRKGTVFWVLGDKLGVHHPLTPSPVIKLGIHHPRKRESYGGVNTGMLWEGFEVDQRRWGVPSWATLGWGVEDSTPPHDTPLSSSE